MEKCRGRAAERSSPVAPKALPEGYSHMPASSWASPPQKMAIPTTTFGVVMPRVWRLYNDNIKVVEAKEYKPLSISMSWTKEANFPRGYSQRSWVAYFATWGWRWVGFLVLHTRFADLVNVGHGILLLRMWLEDVVRREEALRKSVIVRLPFWVRQLMIRGMSRCHDQIAIANWWRLFGSTSFIEMPLFNFMYNYLYKLYHGVHTFSFLIL